MTKAIPEPLFCKQCGEKISSRAVYYAGIKNGEHYTVHPTCWGEFSKRK